jgi:hypothetical protein
MTDIPDTQATDGVPTYVGRGDTPSTSSLASLERHDRDVTSDQRISGGSRQNGQRRERIDDAYRQVGEGTQGLIRESG